MAQGRRIAKMAKATENSRRDAGAGERSDSGPAELSEVQGRRQRTRRVEQLALLSLAIIFGLIGLAAHVLWIVSIVLMALLWGFIASELGSSRREGGVISDVVTAVVSETRDVTKEVSHAASRAVDDTSTSSTSGSESASSDDGAPEEDRGSANPDAEPTKKELYEEAREAGIDGRSNMNKEELQRALDD
jgi:hypothetical protein